MPKDPEQLAHLEWLGYVQPVGLVVSIPALLAAQAHINRNIIPEHNRFLSCLPRNGRDDIIPEIHDFPGFTQTVLGWEEEDLIPVADSATPPEDFAALEVVLPEYNETLRPTYAVKEFEPKEGQSPWLMLIQILPNGTNLDEPTAATDRNWHASPHAKFERLLRETEVPIGLLVNGTHLRLIYAPRGETSGYITFSVAEMAQVAGRSIFAALHMLLSAERLFSLPEKQRLPAILAESRKYQNTVSTKLAEQVLAALYELLRGFQAADDQRRGELLRDVLADDPNHVYHGLLTVLMRLVFILYAEDRGLMPSDPVYANHYSVTGLFERLRAEAGRYPDTMDLRFGAWPQLLTLFRLIYEGGCHGQLRIPPRKGYLFDPDRYPFLEGRPQGSCCGDGVKPNIPHISDGVVFRVLNNLLILDGERLSYRTLDVEQIGSVYETIMGFNLEVAQGRSIAIRPAKSHGAPATINLEELLATKPADRAKWLRDRTGQKVTGQAAKRLKEADTVEAVVEVLDRKIAKHVTPNIVPAGAMVFQPSDERRRSGSHYTPRSLTEPIVRTTLGPVLERLGPNPRPEQILNLKVCDPAMGSGAFLVEACRQLGDELVKAWHVHKCLPKLPPDEDEVLHARRLVAQRCLYGVDKNPMAVDLAKLSLWLATLAKDHPFTFLDHSLRCGDSLVGLSRRQIAGFHWQPTAQRDLFRQQIEERMRRVTEYRRKILAAREDVPYEQLRQQLDVADEQLDLARFVGDLVISAYFSAGRDRQRKARLEELEPQLAQYLSPQGKMEDRVPLASAVHELYSGEFPIRPFHWQIEFPEVFERENGGFDCIVGNPPFLGGKRVSTTLGDRYRDWLIAAHEDSNSNADLVSHFFRRAFDIARADGTFGLIATNTISQGDTRATGLRWICTNGGTVYSAIRRYKWPGHAAVVVSIVYATKGAFRGPRYLDGQRVTTITAYLFHRGGHEDPVRLRANANLSFHGCIILGSGFTFDDSITDGTATPLAEMRTLIENNPRNADLIFPYLGGEEVNTSPTLSHHRYVIDFGSMEEDEARRWPDLMKIVEEKVKPQRDRLKRHAYRTKWWQFGERQPALADAVRGRDQVLVNSQVSSHLSFAFVPTGFVYAYTLNVFLFENFAAFSALQTRVHEVWTRFLASSLEDRLRYTPSDCFETFPFPEGFQSNPTLEQVGREYYEFRAELMVRNNEGLTKTYNRFHNPDERSPDILRLRELHDAMDRAVLEAYGWHDLAESARCEFLLDYEEEEDEEENAGRRRSRRRKPWRYRWPDDFRDEVLARLLELNKQRAEQERLAGLAAEAAGKKKSPAKRRARKKKSDPNQQKMFHD